MKKLFFLSITLALINGANATGTIQTGKDIYNICDFGAIGDGTILNTKAIQKAIDTCAETGGGTVFFPAGDYNTGSLYLMDNITLHLESGATLLQNDCDRKESIEKAGKKSIIHQAAGNGVLLFGRNVKNVSIVGEGTIDAKLCAPGPGRGGLSILFENSENILIKDITVRNSPNWAVTFFGCNHVRVISARILDSRFDGIATISCQHVVYDGVLIENAGDDPFVFANASSHEPRGCGYLTEDVVIKNSTVRWFKFNRPNYKGKDLRGSHAAIVIHFMGVGGVIRNITVNACTFEGTSAIFQVLLRGPSSEPKLMETHERTIENIKFSNITAKNINRILDWQSLPNVEGPVMRNITMENITVDGFANPSIVDGLPHAPISDIRLRNMKLTTTNEYPYWLESRSVLGLKLSNVEVTGPDVKSLLFENGRDLELDNVNINGAASERPVVDLNQVKGVFIHNCQAPHIETFLYAKGDETENVRFADNDFGKVKNVFDIAEEVQNVMISPVAEKVEYSNLSVSKEIKANEGVSVDVTITNTGETGGFNAEVHVDGKAAGSKWIWLKKGEKQQVSLVTTKYYEPKRLTISAGHLATTVTVRPTPADFEFGDRMKINSPAGAGELTTITVSLKNIGGEEGSKEVELYADDEVVTSKKVTLSPGEEKRITIEHRFNESGPRKLKIGDFPVWHFATFANTESNFYQTRSGKIIIEAGGVPHHITNRWTEPSLMDAPDREYAAVYFKDVEGDFAATVLRSHMAIESRWTAGGLIVKNDMTKPGDSSGYVDLWSLSYYPRLAEFPRLFKIVKNGSNFKKSPFNPTYGKETSEITSADVVQDVGIFAYAHSSENELCRVEFQNFEVKETGDGGDN